MRAQCKRCGKPGEWRPLEDAPVLVLCPSCFDETLPSERRELIKQAIDDDYAVGREHADT